jgi:quinol monooxygenase YgiN
MGGIMSYARVVTAKFKPGKREEALRIIDGGPKEREEGFSGILALIHEDDPDSATIISLWDSEDTLNASEQGIFRNLMKATEEMRVGPPEVKNAQIREMRAQLIPIRA